jgi:hypothetical protein
MNGAAGRAELRWGPLSPYRGRFVVVGGLDRAARAREPHVQDLATHATLLFTATMLWLVRGIGPAP